VVQLAQEASQATSCLLGEASERERERGQRNNMTQSSRKSSPLVQSRLVAPMHTAAMIAYKNTNFYLVQLN